MGRGPSDDYYSLLGIATNASVSELRRAWRKLALRWHPDRAGSAATPTFQKLQAAYAVLGDPVARATYDRQIGVTSPITRPAPAVMLRRLSGPLNILLTSGAARHAEAGVIELLVNAQEAAQGGMVTISMRVPVNSPKGIVEELFSAWLAIPPGVADGAVLSPSALLPGMVRPVSFRVRLRR